jgi:hypothetical protein
LSVDDSQFIPQRPKPKKISLDNFHAESVTIRNNIGYYAQGNDGLSIVDLNKVDQPLLLSQTILPGRVMNVQLEGNLAFVSQGDAFLEGKKGWVSIVDVSDPVRPNSLKNIAFGNAIYNVAIDNNMLFVSDNHFFDKKGQLRIYDVSDPSKPKLISSTDLSRYAKFIAYLDKRIYLSDFSNHGVTVIDVSKAYQPKLVGNFRLSNKIVWAIKTAGNRLIVNQNDNLFSVISPDAKKGIREICKVETTDQTNVAGLADYDSIVIEGDYVFRAEGKKGISISKMERDGTCKTIQTLPFDNKFINSLYIVQGTLVAYHGENKAESISLKGILPQPEFNTASEKPKLDSTKTDKPDIPFQGLSKDQIQTLLYDASVKNDAKNIAALCEAGGDPNNSGHNMNSPVEISAMLGNLDALESLLNHGGNPNSNNGNSMTRAALQEKFEAMKLLQKYGGNIGQADADGCTTLHYIAQDGTLEMVKYLVENGVNIDAKCRGGQTAVNWAKSEKNEPVISYLEAIIKK